MSNPLNVAIIGYGAAAKIFHAPVIASVPGLVLKAIVSSDPGKVRADWPAIDAIDTPAEVFARPDIDLVIIPTPNATHFPLARAALEAGKHVVVDKPFTVTVTEAKLLQSEARARGRLLSVFHNRRWDGDFLTLSQIVAAGELGAMVHFESHFDRFRPEIRARWREQAQAGSGLWFDLGPHLLDQTVQLFGLPESISLNLARQRDGSEVDDWFHAVLRYGESRVVLHGGALVPVPAPRFVLHGRQGSFIKHGLDVQEDALKAGRRPGDPGWNIDPQAATVSVWENGVCSAREVPLLAGNYPAYYEGIRDAIMGGGEPPVTVEDAIVVMRLLELGVQSAQSGREMLVLADADD